MSTTDFELEPPPTETASRLEYEKGYSAGYMAGARKGGKPDSKPVELKNPPPPENFVAALAKWSRENLIVPHGHANAGKALVIPKFARDWLDEAMQPGVLEALLCIARKNAKSAICAVLVLAFLCPASPLRRAGFRIGVISINKEKSQELQAQVEAIGKASKLEGIRYMANQTVSDWCQVDYLAAEKNSAHASGFDIVIVDEMGLMDKPKHVTLVAGALTSLSAKDGRMLAITIRGSSELVQDLMDREKKQRRRKKKTVIVHHYAAPLNCELNDRAAWKAANPGLGSIKQLSYMKKSADKAANSTAFESHFRAFDLNQPLDPQQEAIITLAQWKRHIETDRMPPREGRCWVGADPGKSTSMTCAVAYWESGRVEVFGAFPAKPDLKARGKADGVGNLYIEMKRAGELQTFPGYATPVKEFMKFLTEELAGEDVQGCISDRNQTSEMKDAVGKKWKLEFSAVGKGFDGTKMIIAFQKMAVSGLLKTNSLMLKSAIAESVVDYDHNGNACLEKSRSRGRIDALSAACLCCKLASEQLEKPARSFRMVKLSR